MKLYQKNKFLFLALCFPIIQVAAQQSITSYEKGNLEVTENDQWDKKIVIAKSTKGGNDLTSVSSFDRKGDLINKTTMNIAADKKSMKTITEKIYAEYGFKSYSEVNVEVGKSTYISKCTTMNGKVVFADRECEDDAKSLDHEFGRFVGEKAQQVLSGEDELMKYYVNFTVDSSYNIAVTQINKKFIPENNDQLSENEKKIINILTTAPSKYFEGKLRKIGGKFAKTNYAIPINFQGGGY